jgi:hypothetical protein
VVERVRYEVQHYYKYLSKQKIFQKMLKKIDVEFIHLSTLPAMKTAIKAKSMLASQALKKAFTLPERARFRETKKSM